jgi:glycosyltransferase involved in cell wall biosynthesis
VLLDPTPTTRRFIVRYLFVNQYYAPDFAATAQQMSDLCERLAAEGHEVHVLASRAVYDGRDLNLPQYEVLNGVHVHRVGLEVCSRDRLRERALGYLSFFVKAFAKATFMPKADAVVVLTTPPMIGLLGSWLRFTRGTAFIYWVMDVYPEIAIRAGVLRRMGPTRILWSALARLIYRSANRVVVLGGDMQAAIRGKLPASLRDNVEVIHSWSGNAEMKPLETSKSVFRQGLCAAQSFCLMYSGNMGTCHAFGGVIDGIRQMAGRTGIHFAFVGGGKQLSKLKESLSGQKDNVTFLPYQDRGDLDDTLGAPDAHLVCLDPKYDGLLVPSKIYGILAAGRAVLFAGSEHNEIARIIKSARCGIVIPHDDGDAFRQAIEWMQGNREAVAEMGRLGRNYFETHFTTDHLTGLFSGLLSEETTSDAAWSAPRSSETYPTR